MKANTDLPRNVIDSAFWGKLQEGHRLSLSQHCLDVALVFRTLVALPLVRRRMETSAASALSDTQLDRLAVIAHLHDLGKANLGFQDKPFKSSGIRAGHIRELAPLFFEPDLGDAMAKALEIDTLISWFDSDDALEGFLIAAWSHHGAPVRFDESDKTRNYYLAKTCWWRTDGKRDPFEEIVNLMTTARKAFPAAFEPSVSPLPHAPQLQHRFAGLLMLSDWIGSHQTFFPVDRRKDNPIEFSHRAAQKALEAIGLVSTPYQVDLSARSGGFLEWFGFQPRPLQAVIDSLAPKDPGIHLLIAEGETGSGKTEAALARFLHLFATGEVGSLYFALPTRVAAREIYSRIYRYIERVFPNKATRPHVLLAVPGYARMDGMPVQTILPSDDVCWNDDQDQDFNGGLWAAERPKRFLAATVAVGTIDQALLSALQTRHAHLRSACLDRSLLVVDEVHASEPYMRYLLTGLLSHHLGLGGHALLLSATLGSRLRAELTRSAGSPFSMPGFEEACSTPYPALTTQTGTPAKVATVTPDKNKTIRFEIRQCIAHPELLMSDLCTALGAGARVLVVFNTVDRAVALQRAAEADRVLSKEALFRCEGVLCPHHGRFAPADRELLDKAVTARLGKDSGPGPLLLIGTQTLEQSLDIDADLMITDLCPADVLLQRVGRLHRHDRERPLGYEAPLCLVLAPEQGDLEALLNVKGVPAGGAKRAGLGSVYEDMRCLELTRRMLIERPEVAIPQHNRLLVEGATHCEPLKSLEGERWLAHGQLVEGAELAKRIAAQLVAAVYDRPFGDFIFNDLSVPTRTRLGLDTLRVPLEEPVGGPFGRPLTEIAIPGHMAPSDKSEEHAIVLGCRSDTILLQYNGRNYSYSRFGLEKTDESDD